MPESKFSWKKIGRHLKKWLGVYIVCIAALVLINNLVFTVTRYRPSEDHVVRVMVLDLFFDDSATEELESGMLAALQPYDETLEEVAFESVIAAGTTYSEMVLTVKASAGGYDLAFTDETGYEELLNRLMVAPLDDYFPADDPRLVTAVDSETGKTYVAALKVSSEYTDFVDEGEYYLTLMPNSTNMETSVQAMRLMAGFELEGEKAE